MSNAVDSAPATPPEPTPTKNTGRFMVYFTVLCGIVTLASFAFALYWYFQSKQEREPSFCVNPARVRIVDTSVQVPPQLKVLYKGRDLNANVSAATLYLWNAGKSPIRTEDILEPIKLELEPGCEIVDARVLTMSRPVTNFTRGEIAESAKNVLPISFRILEHGDGAALQIIYTGNPEAHVSVRGTIVGAGQPREIPLHPPASRASVVRGLAVIGVGALSAVIIMTAAIETIMKVRRTVNKAVHILAWLCFVICVTGGIVDAHIQDQNPIPTSIYAEQK